MSWVEKNWKPLTVVGGLIGLSWFVGKKFDEADMKRLTITAESFEEGNCLDCDGKGRFYDSYLGKETNCSTCEGKGKHKILGYKDCCYEENIRVHHRGGAIYHDEGAELTYYPAECMVCGREYEAGLPMYSSSTEIVKLEAESFEAESRPYNFKKMPAIFKSWRVNTAYCINDGNENTLCGTGDRWSSRGHGSAGLNEITCQKCKSKWNKLTDEDIERIEEAWERNGFMDSSWYGAETFEATCRDCYGTGGLYDSRLGIDDECASCGGTGESFDAEGWGNSHINTYRWWKESQKYNTLTKDGARKLLETTKKPIKMKVGRWATLYVGRGKVLPNTPQVIGRDEALAFFDNEDGTYVGVDLWEYDDHIFLKATTYDEMWAESFDAESVSDLKLQKDSCCCGATKKTPCLCMIQGTEQCSAKAPMCPCYAEIAMGTKVEMEHTKSREKAEKIAKEHLSEHPDYYSRLKKAGLSAETFNATTPRKGRKKNQNRIKTRFEMDPDMRLNSASNPNNPSVGSIEKECLVEGCSEKVRVNHEIESKRCFKCYNDMMEERGYYRRLDTRYVKGEKRPPWDENLMDGAIVKDEDGSFERFSKDEAVLLFRKSGKSEQLKSLLKHINSMNYELLSNEGLRELLLDLRTYRTLDLGDNGESGEYIVIDDTPFSRNHFHQMLRKLPPLTKLRISGKRDSPLMVEFKYLGEEYIMFLAPYEVDYEDSRMVKSVENHPEFPFWVVKKPNPEKTKKDIEAMLNEDRRKATERVKKRERLRKLQKEARKVMTPEESEEIWNLRVSRKVGVDEELAFYEDILRERKEAESRPVSYMVKSDAHKLNEAARRIHEKADEHQKYPEWWKSKLSVSRNNADQLADFLDYAVIENVFASEGHDHDDHDHEDIDELITKLNTVVDFAITFIHDGGYGGEPKGIFVDDDLGIKTEVVEYVEGSIQLRLVRDIETNELLSVRFSLTGNPEETPIVYLPLPEKLTTIPDDERSSK